jgi:ubiquinone/menaquinone biosynthesis C-methylase UbiE
MMLERVLEQEVMDSEIDASEYAAFDNRTVNAEFVARALELAPASGLVLDVGTGPGEIPILLADRAPRLRIVAIDLAEHMLALARANVAKAGLADRIELECRDVKATGFSEGRFDLVICNSLVHHIPDPEALFRELRRVTRPGAGMFIKDLHRPGSMAELERLVELYARDCTNYQRRSFFDSLHSGLTVPEVEAACERVGWRDVRVRRCSDRHWSLERAAS